MATITVSLPADRLNQLKAVAERFHVAPEELVRVSIEELLTRPDDDFRQALDTSSRRTRRSISAWHSRALSDPG